MVCTLYMMVYCSILQCIAVCIGILQIKKNMHNLGNQTKYILHAWGQTEPLIYERCFLGSSKLI